MKFNGIGVNNNNNNNNNNKQLQFSYFSITEWKEPSCQNKKANVKYQNISVFVRTRSLMVVIKLASCQHLKQRTVESV